MLSLALQRVRGVYAKGTPVQLAFAVGCAGGLISACACASVAALIVPPKRLPVVVTCKLWLERAGMKIIKALARWRWRL